MTIARYTPLPHWVLVALIVVFVNPVTSQPIRTQQWVQNVEFKDLATREVLKAFEKEETPRGSQLSQVGNVLHSIERTFARLTKNNADENIPL